MPTDRPTARRETDLSAPVKAWLQAQGYTVRAEVKHCDLVARRADDLIIVELKLQLNIDLLIQATRRQQITPSVYLAVPRPARQGDSRWRGLRRLVRQLELGLLLVTLDSLEPRIEIVCHPLPYQKQQRRQAKRAVLGELDHRTGDHNTGGSTGRKLVTAWRENALHIACCLDRFGPLAPRQLRALGTGPKTQSLLASRMNYGWFERIDRGIYRLTPAGREGLAEFAHVTGPYLAALPATAP